MVTLLLIGDEKERSKFIRSLKAVTGMTNSGDGLEIQLDSEIIKLYSTKSIDVTEQVIAQHKNRINGIILFASASHAIEIPDLKNTNSIPIEYYHPTDGDALAFMRAKLPDLRVIQREVKNMKNENSLLAKLTMFFYQTTKQKNENAHMIELKQIYR